MVQCDRTDCIHCLNGECFKLAPEFISDGKHIQCIDYQKAKRIKHEDGE